jgi:hypothetical protein
MSNTFKPGQSGNPAGRPKGSRNSLADAFLSDLQTEWVSYGSESIKKMREESPANFVRVVASVMPKVLEAQGSLQDWSDDELHQALAALNELLALPEEKQDEILAVINGRHPSNGHAVST